MGIYLLCVVCESEKRHQNSPPLHSASSLKTININQLIRKLAFLKCCRKFLYLHNLRMMLRNSRNEKKGGSKMSMMIFFGILCIFKLLKKLIKFWQNFLIFWNLKKNQKKNKIRIQKFQSKKSIFDFLKKSMKNSTATFFPVFNFTDIWKRNKKCYLNTEER